MPKCWRKSYVSSRRDGALSWRAAGAFCQLPAEQGFRTAWKDDPREVHFLYATAMSGRRLPSYSKNGWKRIDAAGAVHNVVCVVARGDGCQLRRDGKLPSDLAIATFGDNDCSTSYSARCWQWLNVTAMSRACAGDCPGKPGRTA